MGTPIDRVPVQDIVLRSVHSEAAIAIANTCAVIVSNLPFRFQTGSDSSSAQAHLPTSARFRAQAHQAWYPASYPARPRGGAAISRWFPVAFRHAGLRFLGILFPPGNWALLTVGLPAHRFGILDPDGVSMFRTDKTRLRLGVLYTPGTAVSTRPSKALDRRLPHSSDRTPCCPITPPDPDSSTNEASARIPD